jgi:V/A-type H+/Na+-transporting ATPase subunit E
MANLAALLDQEASAEIEGILSEARARASEIVAEAKEKADAHLAQAARASQVQHEAALVRARSAAQLEASSMKLKSQHEAVERVFAEADKRISALIKDPGHYSSILLKLLSEAMDAFGPGTKISEVVVNPEDRDLIDAFFKKNKLGIEISSDPNVVGGARVKAKGAKVSVENSLPDRLGRAREALAGEVVQVLLRERARG